MHTSLSFMGVCGLLLLCCSCQRRPRRIIVSSPVHIVPDGPSLEHLPAMQNKAIPACETNHADTSIANACLDDDDAVYEALEREAKLPDIPVPQGACPLPQYFSRATDLSEGIVLGYLCPAEREAILSFYEGQMEGLGWRMRAQIKAIESMQMFQKPDRTCIITVRDYKKGARVYQQIVLTAFGVAKNQP